MKPPTIFNCLRLCALAVFLLCSCAGGGSGSKEAALPAGSLRFARGLSISRHNGYTAVTLRDPWDTLHRRQCYILVERGAATPDSIPEGTVIRVPVERVVSYTSVHSALIGQLDCADRLCGVCEPQYITSPLLLSRIRDGRIADLGRATSPDVERIVDLEADAIIVSPYQNSGYGAAEKLGIPIIEASDYMESHPLGRTEWIRFFGLLLGKEAEADSIFNATASRYEELKDLAATSATRPTVLLERKYGSAWLAPSGSSYVGLLHEDAGADYIFKGCTTGEITPLSPETVLDEACNADFWLFKYSSERLFSYHDLEEEYPQYAQFDAFRNGNVYVCNTLKTTYYDDITLHPDLILEDLIALYHPDLLPSHTFRYYFPLSGGGPRGNEKQ